MGSLLMFVWLVVLVSGQTAEAPFSAMGAFQDSITVHVDGKRDHPPLGCERLPAFGADVGLGGEAIPRRNQENHGKNHQGDGNCPPGHVVLRVKPVDGAGGQRKQKATRETA